MKNLSEDIKRYEPRMALDGGNDGLDLIKKVIYKSKSILKIMKRCFKKSNDINSLRYEIKFISFIC